MSKKPSHHAYTVREGKEADQKYWTKIGAAWPHKDGKGFDVALDALPLDGKISLRVPEARDNTAA
jgi:hypothetical protein